MRDPPTERQQLRTSARSWLRQHDRLSVRGDLKAATLEKDASRSRKRETVRTAWGWSRLLLRGRQHAPVNIILAYGLSLAEPHELPHAAADGWIAYLPGSLGSAGAC